MGSEMCIRDRRVSVGLEDLEDLQADFATALEVARGAGRPQTVGV